MNYDELFSELETAPQHSKGVAMSRLSEHQQLAVTAPVKGCAVVIAGPGSGKTTVLIERIAYLLAGGAAPEDLLVCTFTRSAADELQSRLGPKLRTGRLPNCGTMHSLAYRMLGGQQWLVKQGLSLISDDDQLALLHSLLLDAGLDLEFSDKELLLMLQRAQEGASVPSEFKILAATWEEQLTSLGYVDFVMLLKRSLELPTRKRFRFALVDEAQDLTPLQLRWLRAHCAEAAHVYLVGDDDQAVYAFRGSAQAVLADELERGATMFQLRDNWRCRRHIVSTAQALISHNSHRVALPQIPVKPEGDITLARFADESEELRALRASVDKPVVLCRTRQEVDTFRGAGFEAYTMHEAKGREWPFVWISGVEQGVCPHAFGDVEEERRLFYVALTRAKDRLVVANRAKVGDRGRQASQFLKEAGLSA
jgi:DNA helicase II / ATP-dependent DNA helicase PcrA